MWKTTEKHTEPAKLDKPNYIDATGERGWGGQMSTKEKGAGSGNLSRDGTGKARVGGRRRKSCWEGDLAACRGRKGGWKAKRNANAPAGQSLWTRCLQDRLLDGGGWGGLKYQRTDMHNVRKNIHVFPKQNNNNLKHWNWGLWKTLGKKSHTGKHYKTPSFISLDFCNLS